MIGIFFLSRSIVSFNTIDNLKSNGNDILVLGLGTYIIEGIRSDFPISFDISNNL